MRTSSHKLQLWLNVTWLTLAAAIGLVISSSLVVRFAQASDDGGGRSVFATGAGNRALALGGAYAGVADDASATIWNPAGLGLITRKEFQLTQTSLLGLGFSEQYASLVLPSWRWGAAAVSWRRFGVTGIEQRDERGFLLDDDLRDAETELILAHGRTLRDGDLALGGSVKIRRHQLAGHADSGLGLDLGLWSRPLSLAGLQSSAARSLALGLAVRNALEPEIKLQEDSVHDPIALRAGLAWTQTLASRLQLLAALDLERTRGMDGRLHAGLEVGLEDHLALRIGTSDGRLTAGFGVFWQGLRADYQFEDHVLDSIHRFGLTLAFGATNAQQRQRSLAAAEAELQARLEAAFQASNDQREKSLVAGAQADLTAGRWDDALSTIGTLQVLVPTHPELPRLRAAAWSGLAHDQEQQGDLTAAALSWRRVLAASPDDRIAAGELARVQAESDRRFARTREIRKHWEAALDAVALDDLERASAGFLAILRLAPGDTDAARMLEHTRRAVAGRAAADALTRRTEAPAVQASQSPAAVAEIPAAAAAVSTPALTPQRRREIDDLYRRGLEAMQSGRRDEAIRYWELVQAADPEHAQTREVLTREYLAQGLEAFAAGALRTAVTSWENAVRIDPDDPRARGYLERARQQLARMEQISGSR